MTDAAETSRASNTGVGLCGQCESVSTEDGSAAPSTMMWGRSATDALGAKGRGSNVGSSAFPREGAGPLAKRGSCRNVLGHCSAP